MLWHQTYWEMHLPSEHFLATQTENSSINSSFELIWSIILQFTMNEKISEPQWLNWLPLSNNVSDISDQTPGSVTAGSPGSPSIFAANLSKQAEHRVRDQTGEFIVSLKAARRLLWRQCATSIWICSDCVVWHLRVFLETDWNVIVLIDILMERETKLAASPHSMIRWAQSEIICCEWFLTVYDEFASFYRSATFILWYLSFFR